MTYTLEEISTILKNKDKNAKILILSSQTKTSNPQIIREVISSLNDNEIQIRGEAFSTLFLNNHDISDILISSLKSESKNIRSFCALILANRGDKNSVNSILTLTRDNSSMVRSCAFGALGHLRVKKASKEIHNGILDEDIEVKKSAAYAAILIGEKFTNDERKELEKYDDEFKMILKIKNSGPEGI